MIFQKCLDAYLWPSRRIWHRIPKGLRSGSLGRIYGKHLDGLVRLGERKQNHSTYFLRNRAELELLQRLLARKADCSNLKISILACSKGAEVYSFMWAIRSARPDLVLTTHAIDISQEILEFAERGVYALDSFENPSSTAKDVTERSNLNRNTHRDQISSIFERLKPEEFEAMFEVAGDQARIRPFLKNGITWMCGDANDPQLSGVLGPQDIVVANRFLCHMPPPAAERCLRNIARLVKPGGYLFVSGIDLDVRTKVARDMGWTPVTDLLKAVHDGDTSIRGGWPLHYWGLEPLLEDREDREIRYASVFQIGEHISNRLGSVVGEASNARS